MPPRPKDRPRGKAAQPLARVADLIFDRECYPRWEPDQQHIVRLRRALEAGETLPPIIVNTTPEPANRIVDGVHRYHAHLAAGRDIIACEFRDYVSEAELIKDATFLNSASKLPLTTHDMLKVIQIAARAGLHEIDVATSLRTSVAHLRAIAPRYATVADAEAGISAARRVPLKASVRHLSGTMITEAQANEIMGSAPGTSYLLIVRQLIGGLENGLLPDEQSHPALWTDLQKLTNLLRVLEIPPAG